MASRVGLSKLRHVSCSQTLSWRTVLKPREPKASGENGAEWLQSEVMPIGLPCGSLSTSCCCSVLEIMGPGKTRDAICTLLLQISWFLPLSGGSHMMELRWCMQPWSHHRKGALSSASQKRKPITLALSVLQVGLHLCQHSMVSYRQMPSVRIGLAPQLILFSR